MELLDFAKTNTAARLRAAASRGALSHALIFSGSGDRVSAARYAAAAMQIRFLPRHVRPPEGLLLPAAGQFTFWQKTLCAERKTVKRRL